MKLRYFELDRPYVENRQRIEELMDSASLRYKEARVEDYNQNWKCHRKAFIYESKCMASMLEQLFKSVPTKDCWKIIMGCMDKACNPCIINLLGVYTVQAPFDSCTYEASDPVDKKKMLLAALVEGASRVFHKLSIPLCLLGDVVNEIERNHYENSWVWKKKKIQSTTFSTQVKHQIDKVDLFLNIENKDKSIRHLTKTCPAHEVGYGVYLGKLEVNGNFLYLLSKNNEVVSKVSINR